METETTEGRNNQSQHVDMFLMGKEDNRPGKFWWKIALPLKNLRRRHSIEMIDKELLDIDG